MSGTSLDRNLADTRAFYESRVRLAFEPLWGEHLHLGLFESSDEPLARAQERAVESLAEPLALAPEAEVLEVACGLGPAARHLARRFGCRVIATNIEGRQLAQGRALTRIHALEGLVDFAGADFHALPFPDARFDIWWCQEALLHSANKVRVLAEARRVLRPGGRMLLSDITMSAGASGEERARILARVRSPGMWDRPDYERKLRELGLEVETAHDWSPNVAATYGALVRLIEADRAKLLERLGREELDGALGQFRDWIALARAGRIGWAIYLARKR